MAEGRMLGRTIRSSSEPLGYIGLLLRLEDVRLSWLLSSAGGECRQDIGNGWSAIVRFAEADWLVLRQPRQCARWLNSTITNFSDLEACSTTINIARIQRNMDKARQTKGVWPRLSGVRRALQAVQTQQAGPDTSVPAGLTLCAATKCQGSCAVYTGCRRGQSRQIDLRDRAGLACDKKTPRAGASCRMMCLSQSPPPTMRRFAFYKALTRVPRNDVKIAFKQPSMPDVGYRVWIDLSKAHGKHIIGLARAAMRVVLTPCSEIQNPSMSSSRRARWDTEECCTNSRTSLLPGALTLAIAWLSWCYVEAPMIRRGRA